MKIRLLLSLYSAVLLVGCVGRTPPPAPAPDPVILPTLLSEMQRNAATVISAGGLAAVGTGESRSLELAFNRAKAAGRIELARQTAARIHRLEEEFARENGIPSDSLLLVGFNAATEDLRQEIADQLAHALKYETSGELFTAYALITFEPGRIAERLRAETELYERLKTSSAWTAFNEELRAFQEAVQK
jgi:hypothetical protein